MYIEEKDIYASIIKKLQENPFTRQPSWVRGFLLNENKIEILALLHSLQKECIIDAMTSLDETIDLPGLGRFVLNASRKEFADILHENPQMEVEEIEKIVVENYINRKKQNKKKKSWKQE